MDSELRQLFDRARQKSEHRGLVSALVGKRVPGDDPVFEVIGLPDSLHVTIPGKTTVVARNQKGVPQILDYPVLLKQDKQGKWVIVDRDGGSSLAVPDGTAPDGVLPHAFTSHTDVPIDYTGDALKLVRVNAGETALEFTPPVTQYTDEMARDALGTALTAGTGITVTVNDGLDTITIATTITQYTDEMVRDVMGVALVAGTNITITPNDGADTITIDATGAGYTDEQAQDAVGTILVDSATIDFTYTDATPAITAIVIDAAITYAKIQNVSATDRLLGRASAGAGVIEEIALTAFARSIIDDIDAAAVRNTLGLGTVATTAITDYVAVTGDQSVAGIKTFTGGELRIDHATLPFLRIARATVNKLLIGISGATDQLITGTAVGDTAIRAANQKILFSTDEGTTAAVALVGSAVGVGTVAPALDSNASSKALHVLQNDTDGAGVRLQSSNANVELAAGNAFQRIYSGTNTPLYIYTNANIRITILPDGSVGINTVTPAAQLDVLQSTLGSAVQKLASTATNDDPNQIVYQNRVATTDATVTTLHVFTIPASTIYMIEAYIMASRTGGSSGAAGDGAGYVMQSVARNIAGTASIMGSQVTGIAESQPAWDAALDVTGATARIRVTGSAGYNLTWHVTARVWMLST